MNNYLESNEYEIGTTSIRLVRVGNLVEIFFSNKPEAKILYQELAEKYNQAKSQ